MTIAFRPLRNPNPFGFPGGVLPGFDPTHLLSNGISNGHGFSGVASNGGFINVLAGKSGSAIGSPTSATDGKVGICATFPGSPICGYSFSGQSTANDAKVTIAAIVTITGALNSQETIFGTGNNGGGCFLYTNSSTFAIFQQNVANHTGISGTGAGTYFVIGSQNGASGTNYVLVNLVTGATTTASDTSNNPGTPDGTYLVGCQDTSNGTGRNWVHGAIAAVAFAPAFHTIPRLLAIAADPWAFWYPRSDTVLVGASNLRIISTDLDLPHGLFAPNLSPGYRNKPSLAFPSSGIFSSLAISQGIYTLTGKPQTPNSSRSISAAEGTYTQTGETQNLLRGRPISAAQGTYALTGEPQNFNRGIKISAVQGTYTQTGEPQTLGVGIPAVQGSYTLTGKPQSFAVALSIKPVTGTYTLTGLPQVLTNTKFGTSGQALGTKFIADTGNMTGRDY